MKACLSRFLKRKNDGILQLDITCNDQNYLGLFQKSLQVIFVHVTNPDPLAITIAS